MPKIYHIMQRSYEDTFNSHTFIEESDADDFVRAFPDAWISEDEVD